MASAIGCKWVNVRKTLTGHLNFICRFSVFRGFITVFFVQPWNVWKFIIFPRLDTYGNMFQTSSYFIIWKIKIWFSFGVFCFWWHVFLICQILTLVFVHLIICVLLFTNSKTHLYKNKMIFTVSSVDSKNKILDLTFILMQNSFFMM